MPHQYRVNRAVVLAASDICWRCGKPGATTADHVVQIAHGGTHDVGNLKARAPAMQQRIGSNGSAVDLGAADRGPLLLPPAAARTSARDPGVPLPAAALVVEVRAADLPVAGRLR